MCPVELIGSHSVIPSIIPRKKTLSISINSLTLAPYDALMISPGFTAKGIFI